MTHRLARRECSRVQALPGYSRCCSCIDRIRRIRERAQKRTAA